VIERAYYRACLVLARLLRSAKYAKVEIIDRDGDRRVRKRRSWYAPLLVWVSVPFLKLLDVGVRVLPESEWEERERLLYRSLYDAAVGIDVDGGLILPALAGETLATLLEESRLEESVRKRVIERAVAALAELHRLGFTHADAMVENVMIDVDAGVARWFDFETMHESHRPVTWQRADDLRAFVGSCLARTVPEKLGETLRLILKGYGDKNVNRLLATTFDSAFRRPLAIHLSQGALSFEAFQDIARLLGQAEDGTPGRDSP
jgi:hypothetical protein